MHTVRVSASARTPAPPARASAAILDPQNLPRWWMGPVKVEHVDATWPTVGSAMRWRAGGVFEARVVENALPTLVRLETITPTARSIITQRFDAMPDGGTAYEKTVEAEVRGRLAAALMKSFLRFAVKREVKRAAALA